MVKKGEWYKYTDRFKLIKILTDPKLDSDKIGVVNVKEISIPFEKLKIEEKEYYANLDTPKGGIDRWTRLDRLEPEEYKQIIGELFEV